MTGAMDFAIAVQTGEAVVLLFGVCHGNLTKRLNFFYYFTVYKLCDYCLNSFLCSFDKDSKVKNVLVFFSFELLVFASFNLNI
jgi:hypothetical protein